MESPTDPTPASTPPRVVLVHGAASGPWVFDAWRPRWAGFDVRAPDLQDGGDLAVTTMDDYADKVVHAGWGPADGHPPCHAAPAVRLSAQRSRTRRGK